MWVRHFVCQLTQLRDDHIDQVEMVSMLDQAHEIVKIVGGNAAVCLAPQKGPEIFRKDLKSGSPIVTTRVLKKS